MRQNSPKQTIEENRLLIQKLNAIMLKEPSGFDPVNKEFPYLTGFHWTQIYEIDAEIGLPVVYDEGLWRLDAGGEYGTEANPSRRLSVEESNKALKLWLKMAESWEEYSDFSKSLKAQEAPVRGREKQ